MWSLNLFDQNTVNQLFMIGTKNDLKNQCGKKRGLSLGKPQ